MKPAGKRTCTEVTPNASSADGTGDSTAGPGGAGSGPEPLSAFRAKPAYVLLGDPGSGKTTEFDRERDAMGDAAVMVTARNFRTLDLDSRAEEWQGKTLFIDGLDEVRAGATDARAPLDDIRRRLDRLRPPGFRISSREADWLGRNDWQSLKDVSPDSEVAVLRLEPLNEQAARELLSALPGTSDEQAAEFMVQARRRGVGSMLDNPLTLKLLAEAVTLPRDGGWPESRLETFGKACRGMASEHNGEHRAASTAIGARRVPPEALMSAAGLLCAVLLLCDIDGCLRASDVTAGSTEPSNVAGPVPLEVLADAALGSGEGVGLLRGVRASVGLLSAPGGGGDLAVLEHALASKLFTTAGEGVFVPRHRQIAEFLAGRYLAERIADSGSGLPSAGRVVALMSSPSDGGVPTPLRGLSAWLAAHSSQARGRLIDIDPVGVGLYGDIRSFTPDEKERLLRSLGAFAGKVPLFGHQRDDRLNTGYADGTARAFRSLASADTAAAMRSLLASRGVTASQRRFTEFLARVVSEAEESELGELADLAPELLAVLRDPESSPTVKAAALEAYIRTAPDGAGKTGYLKQLLEEVHQGAFPDPRGEMRRILLCCLYPHEVAPSQVWRYTIFQGRNPLSGRFWKFLCYDILELSDGSQVRELLATLHEQVRRPASTPADGPEFREGQKLDAVEQQRSAFLDPAGLNLFDLPVRLLERVLSTSGDDLDPLLLHDWLNTVRTVSGVSMKGTEALLRNIRVWFEDRPRLQKAIYRTWLEHSREDGSSGRFEYSPYAWKFEHDPYDAMHGSRPSAGLGLWCLKKAVEVFDEDIVTAMTLLEAARKSWEVVSHTSSGEFSRLPLFEGAPESLEVVCRRGDGEPFRAALLEGISKPIDELSEQEQFTASQIANRRSHGREILAWQLEKLIEARDAGEFSHAGRSGQWLESIKKRAGADKRMQPLGHAGWLKQRTEWFQQRIELAERDEKRQLVEMLSDHEERMEKAKQEERQLVEEEKRKERKRAEDWYNRICSQETELRENRFPAQSLQILAKVYFNLLYGRERDSIPRDRISGLIGGDPTHVDAAMASLRDAVDRDDIPEAEEIIETRLRAKRPYVAYPVLASLHMLSEEDPARLDKLSTALKRKALAIHYCFSAHMPVNRNRAGFTSDVNPSADWHRRLLKREPGLVLDVLYECAAAGIRSGLENPPGFYDLDDMERWNSQRAATGASAVGNHAPGSCVHSEHANRGNTVDSGDSDLGSQIYDVRLRLLDIYPACFPDEQEERPANSRHRQSLPTLDSLIAAVLRHIDRGHADKMRLTALTERKLASEGLSVEQRVRWLTVDFLVSPQQSLQKLRDYVQQDEIRIRSLAEFHCNTMKRVHPVLSFATESRDPAVLKDTIWILGRSFRPLRMEGLVTPAMEMSDLIKKSISHLGSLESGEAYAALTALIEDPALDCWRDRLEKAQESQRVIYRDASYQHPNMEQVLSTLRDHTPANAADLAELLTDRLSAVSDDLRGGSSNPWRQFWNEDHHGRPKTPKHEESCRDALLEALRKRLPIEVDTAPEGRYAADKRADIRVSFNGFNVPIEIKKNSHRDLRDSIHEQLIGQYTTDPATSGHGIFVVLWFGERKTKNPPGDGRHPSTPGELVQQLRKGLTAEEAGKISVLALDVTKPSSNSAGPSGAGLQTSAIVDV